MMSGYYPSFKIVNLTMSKHTWLTIAASRSTGMKKCVSSGSFMPRQMAKCRIFRCVSWTSQIGRQMMCSRNSLLGLFLSSSGPFQGRLLKWCILPCVLCMVLCRDSQIRQVMSQFLRMKLSRRILLGTCEIRCLRTTVDRLLYST